MVSFVRPNSVLRDLAENRRRLDPAVSFCGDTTFFLFLLTACKACYFRSTVLFLLVSLTACSSHKKQLQPTWAYAPDGIQIAYQADSLLNAYDAQPHALLCVAYQLETVNGFKKLADSREGLVQLLQGKSFDASVMGVKRFFVQPGSQDTLTMSRVEKAKWLGLVTGYYDLDPKQSIRYYEIPFRIKKKGIPLFKKKEAVIEMLTLDLVFSSNSIQEITAQHEKKH